MLVKVKAKKQIHRQWKQGQVTWEEHRGEGHLCKDGLRKAKEKLELNLIRHLKNNRMGFYAYVNQKRKVKNV